LIAYNGSRFHGFQRQPGLKTIEGCIEEVLVRHGFIDKGFSCKSVGYSSASRTDKGVHAIGQVISFMTRWSVPVDDVVNAINESLAPDIVAYGYIAGTPWDFNARYWAITRTYIYYLGHGRVYERDRIMVCTSSVRRDIICRQIVFNGETMLLFKSVSFRKHEIRRIVSCIIRYRRLAPPYNLVLYRVDYPYTRVVYRDLLEWFLEANSYVKPFYLIKNYRGYIDWFIEYSL